MTRLAAAKLFVPVSCLVSSVGLAASVNIGGTESNLSVEYRSELSYANQGLLKMDGVKDPTPLFNIKTPSFNLGLSGKASDSISYSMNYKFVETAFEYAYLDYAASGMVTLRAGLDFVNQGGWENEINVFDTIAPSLYAQSKLPLNGTQSAIEVIGNFGDMARVSLQLTDDVINTNSDPTAPSRFNSSNKAPAWNVEYRGTFGPAAILAQYGKYDASKSSYYALGLNLKIADLDAYIDYIGDTRAYLIKQTNKEFTDSLSNIVADLRYTLDKVQYFFKYSMYDVKQDGTDLEGNTQGGNNDSFLDNGNKLSVGAKCMWQEHYNPYVAYTMRSAKYIDTTDTTKTVSKSDGTVLLGVMGKI